MTNTLLETLQADVFGILSATPRLGDARILADNEGDIETRVLKALAPMSGGESLLGGLAVVVLLPEVSQAEENLPGPPLIARMEIQCIENVMQNRGPNGTGLRSSQAALEVLGALHLMHTGGQLLYADADPIQPLTVKQGYVSHAVRVVTRAGGLTITRAGNITPSIADGDITLTTATEDAVIRYSTDGSYPSAPFAAIYTEPFPSPPAGTVIRAVATHPDMNPSDVLEFTITESEE